jgi:hypothetical protein
MIRNGLFVLAAALALTACASPTAQSTEDRDCFYVRNVRGYEVPDDRTVLVRINNRERYLLSTIGPIENSLDWSSRISIRAPGGFVCTGSGAGVEILGGRNGRTFGVSSVTRAPAEPDAPSGS